MWTSAGGGGLVKCGHLWTGEVKTGHFCGRPLWTTPGGLICGSYTQPRPESKKTYQLADVRKGLYRLPRPQVSAFDRPPPPSLRTFFMDDPLCSSRILKCILGILLLTYFQSFLQFLTWNVGNIWSSKMDFSLFY